MPPLLVQIEDEDKQHDENDTCIAAMMLLNDPQYTKGTDDPYQTDTV